MQTTKYNPFAALKVQQRTAVLDRRVQRCWNLPILKTVQCPAPNGHLSDALHALSPQSGRDISINSMMATASLQSPHCCD